MCVTFVEWQTGKILHTTKKGMLWLVVLTAQAGSRVLFKNNPGKMKNTDTEATGPSFPGDTSFAQGGFWSTNEEPFTKKRQQPFTQRCLPLLLLLSCSLSLAIPPSPITTPISHFSDTFTLPEAFLLHFPKIRFERIS